MDLFPFDVVVVTSPDPKAAPVQTLESYLPAKVRLVSTTDPFGASCGSGGGTLAALECCRTEDSILIIHAGGESSRCPTQMVMGKAWTSLPMMNDKQQEVVISNPTILLLQVLSCVFRNIPKGSIVVSASDCILDLPITNEDVDWSQYQDCVLGVAVPAPLSTAKNHGVYCIHNGKVTQFLQKPSIDVLKEMPHCLFDGDEQQAWIDTGIVAFLSGGAADKLWSLVDTMKACTERGLRHLYETEARTDESLSAFARRRAIKLELYTHLMMASSFPSSFQQYVQACGSDLPLSVLQELYTTLSPLSLQAMTFCTGNFTHLGTLRELLEFYFQSSRQERIVRRAHSFVPYSAQTFVAMNVVMNVEQDCRIGEKSVLEHSHLSAKTVDIGEQCLLSGVCGTCHSLKIPNGMIFQMIRVKDNGTNAHVYMYLGLDDEIKKGSAIWGVPVEDVLLRTGLNRSDLWDESADHTVWKARIHPIVTSESNKCNHGELFYWLTELKESKDTQILTKHASASHLAWKNLPRISLSDIRQCADAVKVFQIREKLEKYILPETVSRQCLDIREVLMNRHNTECNVEAFIGPFAATRRWSEELTELVEMLDTVILDAVGKRHYDVSGRASMILCELLGNLSSAMEGCGSNSSFAATELSSFDLNSLVPSLLASRNSVLKHDLSSSRLVSAAATMQQCASIMTQQCVANLTSPSSLPRVSPIPVNTWVVATAPARIDLAGGWSDTPPICIEHGGAVCNVAVTVDGRKPLSCRCRLVQGSTGVHLRSEGRDIKTGELISESTILLSTVGDLIGYDNPKSPCSLIKCALVYCGLVSAEQVLDCRDENLSIFLKNFCGIANVGLEIFTTSLLPHGSGMGTSSILGGCVLSAITKCVGIDTSEADLNHMVLMLEQMLCTGGGWQDQVGGLIGGAKLCTSENALPLQMNVEQIVLAPSFQDNLNRHLLLVFTGQTRLAKNILQDVLQNWARRSKTVVETVNDLTAGAHRAKECLQNQDLNSLSSCLNAYWTQKKAMAGKSSEPVVIRHVLTKLLEGDMIQAGSLCGAGGGGFMVLILKGGREPSEIQEFCRGNFDKTEIGEFVWHDCKLTSEGLTTVILEDNGDSDAFDMSWHHATS